MSEPAKKKIMPKGIRKGGVRFPRQSLVDALPWAKKLVVKTHLAPQPQDVILSGVVGNSSSVGQIRLSSLKQYGLMEGDSKAYLATQLARQIDSAPIEERAAFLRRAALMPTVFKALFDTFQGDEVSTAKLRQRAAELKVHPEETENCVDNYAGSLVVAGLARTEGDKVLHIAASEIDAVPIGREVVSDANGEAGEDSSDEMGRADDDEMLDASPRPKAVFNVTVNLDASLDVEKLEKQLKLLKRYGAI